MTHDSAPVADSSHTSHGTDTSTDTSFHVSLSPFQAGAVLICSSISGNVKFSRDHRIATMISLIIPTITITITKAILIAMSIRITINITSIIVTTTTARKTSRRTHPQPMGRYGKEMTLDESTTHLLWAET